MLTLNFDDGTHAVYIRNNRTVDEEHNIVKRGNL